MQFKDKEIETEIILKDGQCVNAVSRIEFRVQFEARNFGIKDTYVSVESIQAIWDEDEEESDDGIIYCNHHQFEYDLNGVTLLRNGKVIWNDNVLDWDTIVNLDTSGMIIVHKIEIDIADKTIELSL